MTHPFHPLFGREFPLVTYRHNWSEHRVYFHDEQGQLKALPAGWTDIFPADPFIIVSGGRSAFRFHELRELSRLLGGIEEGEAR